MFSEKLLNRDLRESVQVEKEALCYDARNNRYSISPNSIPSNLFYTMELGAQTLIDVWPFFQRRLLDIGCGNKPYELFINPLVNQYVGIDLPRMNNSEQSDLFADGLKLPFRSRTFNTVLSIDVLDEVPSPIEFMREANRMLDEDGHLILMLSNNYNVFKSGRIYARYTANGLRNLAEQCGFNVVLMRTKGTFIPFILNFMIQSLFRIRNKFSNNFSFKKNKELTNFHQFESFMKVLQKIFLKITPSSSIGGDIDLEESKKPHLIWGNFSLGYVMVAKKVFCLD